VITVRTALRVRLVTAVSAAVAFAAVGLARGDTPVVGYAVFLGLLLTVLLGERRLVLTEGGLDVRHIGSTVIPWSQITSIEVGGRRWNSRTLRLGLVGRDRPRRLPAPYSAFSVGEADVDATRQLIEQWWTRYRDVPPARIGELHPSADPWAAPPPE
jgi:hypothetical protein